MYSKGKVFIVGCGALAKNSLTFEAYDALDKSDIIVANSGSNNVGVLFNIGDGTFLPQTTYTTDISDLQPENGFRIATTLYHWKDWAEVTRIIKKK